LTASSDPIFINCVGFHTTPWTKASTGWKLWRHRIVLVW
jgi:hypothetical protein